MKNKNGNLALWTFLGTCLLTVVVAGMSMFYAIKYYNKVVEKPVNQTSVSGK